MTTPVETLDQVIDAEFAALPMYKRRTVAQWRKHVADFQAVAERIREGQNEHDTVQSIGCSCRVYRRIAAAVAAESAAAI